MAHYVASLDTLLAVWLAALPRVIFWAGLSAVISMTVYACFSPQQKILALKERQRTARAALMRHEGDFKQLGLLIRQDLALSLKQIGLALLPFLLSLAPLALLMFPLSEIYTQPLAAFGPGWMQGFEFWYIAVVLVASLAIKMIFKIA